MLRHMVHLRFRSDIPDDAREALYARLAALTDALDGASGFVARRNESVEDELVRGFREVFWIDFADASARDAYLLDPTHKAIGEDIIACLDGSAEGVFVCDVQP